ncbi:hypothetical protein niasHT_015228 [Heterodera trifolii]|uniref:DNA-directed DNA polymerase n=1 Tax=Heterodera trifolii TaxID=157864 RepID=A0ABD2L2M3_9BILA
MFIYGAEDYDVSILLYFDEGHFNGVQKNGNCLESLIALVVKGLMIVQNGAPKVARLAAYGREGHKCNERWCENCQIFHEFERGCFIRPLEPNQKKEAVGWRLVPCDLETTQHTPVDPDFPEKRKHRQFRDRKSRVSGLYFIRKMEREFAWQILHISGYYRTVTFSQMPFHDTKVDKQNIDRHPLVSFVKWILYKMPKQYNTIGYSHFGGEKQEKDEPKCDFPRQSWNLIPGPLASMVPIFGLDVQDKPFFPHLANRPENYGCNLFPTKSDYLADGMNFAKRKEFDKWYQQNRNTSFWHACSNCYPDDNEVLPCGKTAGRIREKTNDKWRRIRRSVVAHHN